MKYANEFLDELKNKLRCMNTWKVPLLIDGRECDGIELKGSNNEGDWRIEITTKEIEK